MAIERSDPEFSALIAREIWEQKYQLKQDGVAVDLSLDDTFWRVARAAAGAERGGKRVRDRWAATFHEVMARGDFLPGGRILAGSGTGRDVTLFNCFVLGRIEDDLSAIFESVKEAALTMQAGGGIGHDFSTLRPRGAAVRGVGATASGPVSFMDVWDAMCLTIMSAGQRRGAMMATLRCDHPDIEEFIAAKADPHRLRNFNLSVLVSDAFIAAVKAKAPWDLVFEGKVFKTVSAFRLWESIARSNYDYAEPGVIFIDRVNGANNLNYCETISATNPCGEQPLPPYGACLLGSLNLVSFVQQPFTREASFDGERLARSATVAVRLMDDVIDVSRYPLDAQREEARAKRRIGLGVTGLADALIMMGVAYGSPRGRALAAEWMAAIQNAAYRASAELAGEKGAFALYDAVKFLARPNVERLNEETRKEIARHGVRNGCLTSIAPTGTISLLAGNVSSGIEPVFDFQYMRRIVTEPQMVREERVEDYAHALYRSLHCDGEPHGEAWVTAGELSPQDHLAMQAALQPHVDSAISKTINCPAEIDSRAFESLYLDAFDRGLKGCTLFRPNAVTGQVLTALAPSVPPVPADAAEGTVQDGGHKTAGSIVYMSEPLARDAVLAGTTTKLKWPGSDHAYYITINDIVRDGRRRPFEIFINTKDLTHYPWTVALTRMISAVFRRGGDLSFVGEELRAVFDPQGGQWVGGTYVPSLLAAIGGIIQAHLDDIGRESSGGREAVPLACATAAIPAARGSDGGLADGARRERGQARPLLCPRCSSPNFKLEGGCRMCLNCGHSSCG